jgi:hypothetical protein
VRAAGVLSEIPAKTYELGESYLHIVVHLRYPLLWRTAVSQLHTSTSHPVKNHEHRAPDAPAYFQGGGGSKVHRYIKWENNIINKHG